MPGIRIIDMFPEISLAAEPVFEIFGFSVSNTIIASWLTMLILVVISLLATKNMKLVPTGLQNLVEMVLDMFYDGIVKSRAGDRARLFFPLSATIFFFILLSNWFGALIPGFGTIGFVEHHHGKEILVPFLRSACSGLNTTLALALFSVIGSQVYAIKAVGFGYLKRFLSFMGPLEVFDELAKLLSFSFRLFGNIFAGEVLLIVIALLLPVIAPLPFQALELFVGFIQAFIFASLTVIFLTAATAHHG
jgi:F-type H+-transporting ATPase subunit a